MPALGMMKVQPYKIVSIDVNTADVNLRSLVPIPYQATVVLKVLNVPKISTVTITIASPAVINWTSHGLSVDQSVVFTTTGALPTNITAGVTYWVIAAGLTADSFQISTEPQGAPKNISGTQSGVHTATAEGGLIYSSSVSTPAFQTGSGWPKGTKLRLINGGTIIGKQGSGGGLVADVGQPGTNAGDAIKLDENLKIDNTGIIGGGGGGGGAGSRNGGDCGGGASGAGMGIGTVGTGVGAFGLAAHGVYRDGGNGGGAGLSAPGGDGGTPGVAGSNGPNYTDGGGGAGGGGLGANGGTGGRANSGGSPGGAAGQSGKAVDLNGKILIWERTGNRYGTYT
jgi:hypothetical protein